MVDEKIKKSVVASVQLVRVQCVRTARSCSRDITLVQMKIAAFFSQKFQIFASVRFCKFMTLIPYQIHTRTSRPSLPYKISTILYKLLLVAHSDRTLVFLSSVLGSCMGARLFNNVSYVSFHIS
jgi:hypothetical protein